MPSALEGSGFFGEILRQFEPALVRTEFLFQTFSEEVPWLAWPVTTVNMIGKKTFDV